MKDMDWDEEVLCVVIGAAAALFVAVVVACFL